MAQPDIIIYGGTFDPPHIGHFAAAANLIAASPKSEVWIMPSQPFYKSPGATFHHRLQMCRLAFQTLVDANLHVRVTDLEYTLPQPSYTHLTLNHIYDHFGKPSMGFLLGDDQLRGFPRWVEPHQILSKTSLYVMSRAQDFNFLSALASVRKELDLPLMMRSARTAVLGSSEVHHLEGRVVEVNATSIRLGFQNHYEFGFTKFPDWRGILNPSVTAYIKEHSLYRPS